MVGDRPDAMHVPWTEKQAFNYAREHREEFVPEDTPEGIKKLFSEFPSIYGGYAKHEEKRINASYGIFKQLKSPKKSKWDKRIEDMSKEPNTDGCYMIGGGMYCNISCLFSK